MGLLTHIGMLFCVFIVEHDAQAFHPYAKAAPAQENKTDAQGDSSPDKEGDDGQKRRYGG